MLNLQVVFCLLGKLVILEKRQQQNKLSRSAKQMWYLGIHQTAKQSLSLCWITEWASAKRTWAVWEERHGTTNSCVTIALLRLWTQTWLGCLLSKPRASYFWGVYLEGWGVLVNVHIKHTEYFVRSQSCTPTFVDLFKSESTMKSN